MAGGQCHPTQLYMMALLVLIMATFLAGVGISLTVQSPKARFELITVPTPPPTQTTTSSSSATSLSATTTSSVTTTTTSGSGSTTPPILPINLTCPGDSLVVLGFNFEPAFTGGFATASGGCITPPVVTWTDTTVGLMPNKRNIVPEQETIPRWTNVNRPGHVIEAPIALEDMHPVMMTDMHVDAEHTMDFHYGEQKKKRKLRSPSFNVSNLVVVDSPLHVSNTGAIASDAVAAVGPHHVVFAVNSAAGAVITVTDKNDTSVVLGVFQLNSMGAANCSGSTRGSPQVIWDEEAERWVLMELGQLSYVCVYWSNSSDPLGSSYSFYMYDFAPYAPELPKLGRWRQAYLLSFVLTPTSPSDDPKNMCVMQRAITGVNATIPSMFCAASLLNRLANFTAEQGWTPVHAEHVMPPASTETAGAVGGVGAVFMRQVDDELHDVAHATPAVDFIEVEHWSNVNWTTATFAAQRYRINVMDFNSTTTPLVSTPSSEVLNSMRFMIDRLVYRYIPSTGQESLVGAFSTTGGVRWFELRWSTPSVAVPKTWRLFQEGNLNGDAWLGSAGMDANGTIALVYSVSNALTYPSLYVTSRLANDPLGAMRVPLLLEQGAVGSVFTPMETRWGRYSTVCTDNVNSRYFYVTGQRSDTTHPWVASLTRLHVLGETTHRLWRAQDTCGGDETCLQVIVAK